MNKICFSIIWVLLLTTSLSASKWTPIQIGLFGPLKNYNVYGLNFGIINHTIDENIYGIQIGIIANHNDQEQNQPLYIGLQLSPFRNYNRAPYYGWQISLLNQNTDGDMPISASGVQMGLINISSVNGVQVGGFNLWCVLNGFQLGVVNFLFDSRGLSLGFICNINVDGHGMALGLINYANGFSGFQLGLLNYCKKLDGVQVGLVNISENSKFKWLPFLNWNIENNDN